MQNNERTIYCDECRHEWLYKETKVEETHFEDDEGELFIVTAFHCPNCNKQYLVCVDNEVTLSEREEIAKTHRAIQRSVQTRQGGVYMCLMSKMERVQARLVKHQDQLREAYLIRLNAGTLKQKHLS